MIQYTVNFYLPLSNGRLYFIKKPDKKYPVIFCVF
jgi:hypothetical protein